MAVNASNTKDLYTVLVTGVNSGLGFGICCRLIDEFLPTRPQSQILNLIFTTRSHAKSDATLLRIRDHLQKYLRRADKQTPGISKLLEPRIILRPELVDVSSLSSIRRLAQKLVQENISIDVLIHNAGVAGNTGIDWWKVAYQSFTDLVNLTTYPIFLIQHVGWRTDPQLVDASSGKLVDPESEPELGMMFTTNVFGPYMLTHQLMPLLGGGHDPARIIWVGSLDAFAMDFKMDDFQAMKTDHAYSSTKRLVDFLTLTYALPSTEPWVSQLLSVPDATVPQGQTTKTFVRPRVYNAHPGIAKTNMHVVPLLIDFLWYLTIFCYRILGNMWQVITGYSGATSMVWLALASQSQLDDTDAREGVSKWGSAVDSWGRERVEKTEVEGWGIGGKEGDSQVRRKGTWSGMKRTTRESREEFEINARECWKEMERLRVDWERRLGWDHA